MKNYNWRTKLKTNKNFIRELRTKIKNKKNKDWNWNIKNKRANMNFFRKREKRKKTTSDKPFIHRHHVSFKEKKETVTLLII
jgi:hypothetical protein